MVSKELLNELKLIIEEDYNIKLSNRSVERIATFLISYIKLLKEANSST